MEDISDDFLEKNLCEPLHKAKKFPMDEYTTKILIQLCMGDSKFQIPEKDKPFLYKVIETRLPFFTYEIKDTRLIFFIAVLSRVPGLAIMYLWYLQYWARNNRTKTITLDLFSSDIFPMGFPAKEVFDDIWEKQKGPKGQNLIDNANAGKSLLVEL